MSPHDAKQFEPNQKACLLVGRFDPPTMAYWWASEKLFTVAGVDHVWFCPLAGPNDKVGMMTMVMASSFSKPVTCCTVGIDKGFTKASEILEWCKKRYPEQKFTTATMAPCLDGEIILCFSNQHISAGPGKSVIHLNEHVPIDETQVASMISRGEDAQRKVPEAVWGHILKYGIYRPHRKGEGAVVPNP
jgi:nicotinic acid mononucleotide adenylyltransferase